MLATQALNLISNSVTSLLGQAAAPAAPGAQGPLGGFLLPVLLIGLAYFLLIRPMSKDEKTRKARVSEIKKGTEVVLQGGIVGRISNWDDPHIAVVEVSKNVKLRVLKRDIQDIKSHVLEALAEKSGDKKDDKKSDSSEGDSK